MRRRDEQQFAEFAAGARERLRRTAYLISGDWELASDIVQEALIRVYVAWPRIEVKGTVHAYARRCLVNVAIDMGRRRSSTELPSELTTLDRAAGDADLGVPAREAILAALRELPPRQRACVVLRFFEDLSVHDTAQVLRCSEGTVKSQTARGLDTLRELTHIHDLADEGALS